METSLILLIIGFLVVAYLIFKLIKKVIFAVIAIVLVFFLLVGGVFGLVYLDFNHLTSQQDYNVNLVYVDGDNYLFGVNLPIENQSLVEEDISKISRTELDSLDIDNIDKDEGVFVVLVEDELFESLVVKDSYDLNALDGADFSSYEDFNLTLSKEEVLSIVNSEDGVSTFLDILYTKNNIEGALRDASESLIRANIESLLEENNMSFRGMLFAFVLSESLNDEEALFNLLEGYKNEELVIVPDRISFKALRMLPIDTVKKYVLGSDETLQ